MPEAYRRHLPHQVPAGHPIFLTWNLKGSLPRVVWQELESERIRLEGQPPRMEEWPYERKVRHDKLLFHRRDQFLDRAATGPLHLKEPAAAQVVADAICFGVPERYELFAFVVMANHVHMLIAPHWELSRLMKGIKGFTAHRLNRLQNAPGRVLWQDESYDHWVRDEEELFRIIQYIENNPVAAGLCREPREWRWSSAAMREWWPLGEAYSPHCLRETKTEPARGVSLPDA
jgi:REP element-mobilizing transposase RayT